MTPQGYIVCLECDHAKDDHDIGGSGECSVGWSSDGMTADSNACDCVAFEEVSPQPDALRSQEDAGIPQEER